MFIEGFTADFYYFFRTVQYRCTQADSISVLILSVNILYNIYDKMFIELSFSKTQASLTVVPKLI